MGSRSCCKHAGIRAESERITGIAIVVLALGASAVAVAASARLGADPESLYVGGRLVAPISYVNAAAAFFLVGLWPALVLAARRELHPLLRGTALAAGAAMLAGWLGTQSKGGAIALAVSAIVVFARRARPPAPARADRGHGRPRALAVRRADRAVSGPGRRRRDPPRGRGLAA